MATTVDVNDAQGRLRELVELAKAGDEVVIAEGATPVARLTAIVPAPEPPGSRVAGLHRGAAWVSEDFDQPLPDEFWAGNS